MEIWEEVKEERLKERGIEDEEEKREEERVRKSWGRDEDDDTKVW